jgi:hypothetical protein
LSLGLTLGLLLGAGCGLAEYERKMAEEQERIRYLDEENKHLEAGPVRLPEKKEADPDAKTVQPAEVFFRPPKGIALNPDERPVVANLYRYRATGASPAFPEVFLAVSKDGSGTFQQDILRSLGSSAATRGNKEIKRPGREPLRFEMYKEPLRELTFFFSRTDVYQVAVVFHAAESAATTRVMDFSLGSLALGGAAGVQHRAYQSRSATGSTGRVAR